VGDGYDAMKKGGEGGVDGKSGREEKIGGEGGRKRAGARAGAGAGGMISNAGEGCHSIARFSSSGPPGAQVPLLIRLSKASVTLALLLLRGDSTRRDLLGACVSRDAEMSSAQGEFLKVISQYLNPLVGR